MADNTSVTVSVVDTTENKYILVYGGDIDSPITFLDIYNQLILIKPEWVSKNEKFFSFFAPIVLGDINSQYYSYFNDEFVSISCVNNTNVSRDNIVSIVNIDGTLNNVAISAHGNILIDNSYEDVSPFITNSTISAYDGDININSSVSTGLILSFYKSIISGNNINLDSGCFSFEYVGFYNGPVNIYTQPFLLKNCNYNENGIVIKTDCDYIEHPIFDSGLITFDGESLTAKISNPVFVSMTIKNTSSASDNMLSFIINDNVNNTVYDFDDLAVNNASMVIKDFSSNILYSGTTDSNGECNISKTVLKSIYVEHNSEIVSNIDFGFPYTVSINKNGRVFYDKIYSLTIDSHKYTFDVSAISAQKILGYQIDVDNKMSTSNKIRIDRNTAANIRCRLYDVYGSLLNLSSATVNIYFYNNSWDSTPMQTNAATLKTDNGEVLFTISSVNTALLVNSRYYYRITVNGSVSVSDSIDVTN